MSAILQGQEVRVVRFGELAETEQCRTATGLDLAQIRSLRSHPLARPGDPAALVMVSGDRITARLAVMPGRVRIGAHEDRVGWGVANWEYDGDPAHRGGAGLLFMVALREVGNWAACGHSEFSRPIYVSLRHQFVSLPRRAALLRPRAFLARRLGPAAAAAAAPPVRAALFALRPARRSVIPREARALRLEPVERFDETVETIDEAARPECWFPRDHRELNWAIEQPWLGPDEFRHHAFVLMAGDHAVGYALARLRHFEGMRLGSLLRGTVAPGVPGAAEALVSGLVSTLGQAGADIVDICTANDRLLAAAHRLGLRLRGKREVSLRLTGAAKSALAASGSAVVDFEADLGEGDVIFA